MVVRDSNCISDFTMVEFWDKMSQLLEVNYADESEVNTALVSYIKIAADHYTTIIQTEQDLYRVGLLLVDSRMFEMKSDFCLRKLLSLLSIDLLELNLKLVISYVLLYKCKTDLNAVDMLLDNQGFTVFYNNIYSNFAFLNKYGEESMIVDKKGSSESDIEILETIQHSTAIMIEIFYQIFRHSKCQVSNLQMIDDFFIYFLMNTVRSDTIEDMLNNVKFRLLLALNEQYMIFSCDFDIENKVYEFLLNHAVSKDFIGLLLLKFNREKDSSILIMMCKLIYILLTKELQVAREFFYLNDLNVFVDVLLRNLNDISEEQESLRNIYLRVLTPLLMNTELSETKYHKDEIREALKYFSYLENFCSRNEVTLEQRTTAKLARKCLRDVKWLEYQPEDNSNPSDSESSRRSSSSLSAISVNSTSSEKPGITPTIYANRKLAYSADSIHHRGLQPPPPPPPRKAKKVHGTGRSVAIAKVK